MPAILRRRRFDVKVGTERPVKLVPDIAYLRTLRLRGGS